MSKRLEFNIDCFNQANKELKKGVSVTLDALNRYNGRQVVSITDSKMLKILNPIRNHLMDMNPGLRTRLELDIIRKSIHLKVKHTSHQMNDNGSNYINTERISVEVAKLDERGRIIEVISKEEVINDIGKELDFDNELENLQLAIYDFEKFQESFSKLSPITVELNKYKFK